MCYGLFCSSEVVYGPVSMELPLEINVSDSAEIRKDKKTRKKWNPATESQLIELMKRYTMLWHPKDPDFNSYSKKNECYSKIAEEMNLGPMYDKYKIKEKIKNLRDSFQREEKRFREHNGNFTSRWEHYPAMCFLKEVETYDMAPGALVVETPLGGDGPLKITFPTDDEVMLGQCADKKSKEYFDPLNCDSARRVSEGYKRHRSVKHTQRYEKITKRFFSLLHENPKDDCDHFGSYVSAHLKSLPEGSRTKVKENIQEILFPLSGDIRPQATSHESSTHSLSQGQINQHLIISDVRTEFISLDHFDLG